MRVVFGTVCLLLVASPAMAVTTPAPLLGVGLSAMAVVGGGLLAARLFKRK